MIKHPTLIVAPEVVHALGGAELTREALASLDGRYKCTVCGEEDRLKPDAPATVIVVFHPTGAEATPVVRLAHPGCSGSGIRLATEPALPNATFEVPAAAWLRPPDADPPAVVLVGPRARTMRLTAAGEVMDSQLSALLNEGFALLAGPQTELPDISGWGAELGAYDQVAVYDSQGDSLYEGPLPSPADWRDAVNTTQRVGVVVASGLDLLDSDADQLADLFAAIRKGAAVGATVPLMIERSHS